MIGRAVTTATPPSGPAATAAPAASSAKSGVPGRCRGAAGEGRRRIAVPTCETVVAAAFFPFAVLARGGAHADIHRQVCVVGESPAVSSSLRRLSTPHPCSFII